MSGKINVAYGDERYQLEEGDCLHFGVDLPVTFQDLATGESRCLLVITRQ